MWKVYQYVQVPESIATTGWKIVSYIIEVSNPHDWCTQNCQDWPPCMHYAILRWASARFTTDWLTSLLGCLVSLIRTFREWHSLNIHQLQFLYVMFNDHWSQNFVKKSVICHRIWRYGDIFEAYLIFVIFSPQAQFFLNFSPRKIVNRDKTAQ